MSESTFKLSLSEKVSSLITRETFGSNQNAIVNIVLQDQRQIFSVVKIFLISL